MTTNKDIARDEFLIMLHGNKDLFGSLSDSDTQELLDDIEDEINKTRNECKQDSITNRDSQRH